MSNVVDFETTSENFQNSLRIDSVSHCDKLEITNNCVVLIEETVYIDKNLIDKNIYRNEISELIKKMWGSFAILLWYSIKDIQDETLLRRKRIFLVQVKVKKRYVKILSKLVRELKRHKNGAYLDIKLYIEEEVE